MLLAKAAEGAAGLDLRLRFRRSHVGSLTTKVIKRASGAGAIRELDLAGQPITVAGVAALARVDRSYIYAHSDLLAEIRHRRAATPIKLAARPAAETLTVASLQARLATAHEEITRLAMPEATIRGCLISIRAGPLWPSSPPRRATHPRRTVYRT